MGFGPRGIRLQNGSRVPRFHRASFHPKARNIPGNILSKHVYPLQTINSRRAYQKCARNHHLFKVIPTWRQMREKKKYCKIGRYCCRCDTTKSLAAAVVASAPLSLTSLSRKYHSQPQDGNKHRRTGYCCCRCRCRFCCWVRLQTKQITIKRKTSTYVGEGNGFPPRRFSLSPRSCDKRSRARNSRTLPRTWRVPPHPRS